MIIIGVKDKALNIQNISDACPVCKSTDSLQMTLYQQYVSLFLIPFCPTRKHAVTICNHCKATFLLEYMSPSFRQVYNDMKAKSKTPIWIFTGAGIVFIGLIFLAIYIKIDSDNTDKLVKAPQKNDVFEIRLETGKYTIYKVQHVKNDSVYFFANKYQVTELTGLNDLFEKEFETSVTYGMPVSKLVKMRKDGDIIDIIKK